MSGQTKRLEKPAEEIIDLTEEPIDEITIVGPVVEKKKPVYYECPDDYSAFDGDLSDNSSSNS